MQICANWIRQYEFSQLKSRKMWSWQVSAVQKIARIMPLKPGLKLYRGLGGNVSLPRCFYKTNENGCRGFTEWGFMSTTSDREVTLWQNATKCQFMPEPFHIPTATSQL
jgi:hypothetical protein